MYHKHPLDRPQANEELGSKPNIRDWHYSLRHLWNLLQFFMNVSTSAQLSYLLQSSSALSLPLLSLARARGSQAMCQSFGNMDLDPHGPIAFASIVFEYFSKLQVAFSSFCVGRCLLE